jgi:hypothetical protein
MLQGYAMYCNAWLGQNCLYSVLMYMCTGVKICFAFSAKTLRAISALTALRLYWLILRIFLMH